MFFCRSTACDKPDGYKVKENAKNRFTIYNQQRINILILDKKKP